MCVCVFGNAQYGKVYVYMTCIICACLCICMYGHVWSVWVCVGLFGLTGPYGYVWMHVRLYAIYMFEYVPIRYVDALL